MDDDAARDARGKKYGWWASNLSDAEAEETSRNYGQIALLFKHIITDYLWQTLYSNKSIHTEQQVKEESNDDLTKHTQAISEFNSKVWNEKKQKGLSLKDSIKIEIPKELEIFKKDLVAMHHLE